MFPKSTLAIPSLACLFAGCALPERAALLGKHHVQVIDTYGAAAEATIGPPYRSGRGLSSYRGENHLRLYGPNTSVRTFLEFAFMDLGISPARLCIETPLPDGRCRWLVQGESQSACEKALCEALRASLGLRAFRETRALDVYVLTAPLDEVRMSQQPHRENVSDNPSDNLVLPLTKATTADLCTLLESLLARPVVDESSVSGKFDFCMRIPASHPTDPSALATMVEDHFGLRLRSARRDIEVLVVKNDEPPAHVQARDTPEPRHSGSPLVPYDPPN